MIIYLAICVIVGCLPGCRNDVGGGPDGGDWDGESEPWIPAPEDTDPEKSFEGTASGLTFEPPRGVYDSAMTVTVSHETLSEVRYTLDGSDPRTSTSALVAALPLSLLVDPTDSDNPYTAPGVVIRATAEGPDASPGAVDDDGRVDNEYRMRVDMFDKFQPQWLHHRLTENAAYRARFAARARGLLETGGLLTPSNTTALFQARVDEIESAIIAESARWGDAHRSPSRTKNDDWLPAIERVKDGFLAKRTDILKSQLSEAGLY